MTNQKKTLDATKLLGFKTSPKVGSKKKTPAHQIESKVGGKVGGKVVVK